MHTHSVRSVPQSLKKEIDETAYDQLFDVREVAPRLDADRQRALRADGDAKRARRTFSEAARLLRANVGTESERKRLRALLGTIYAELNWWIGQNREPAERRPAHHPGKSRRWERASRLIDKLRAADFSIEDACRVIAERFCTAWTTENVQLRALWGFYPSRVTDPHERVELLAEQYRKAYQKIQRGKKSTAVV